VLYACSTNCLYQLVSMHALRCHFRFFFFFFFLGVGVGGGFLFAIQLYGIVVRVPDSGLRGPRFESRTRRIFHDLGKVFEY
jgi:hypothetical protein